MTWMPRTMPQQRTRRSDSLGAGAQDSEKSALRVKYSPRDHLPRPMKSLHLTVSVYDGLVRGLQITAGCHNPPKYAALQLPDWPSIPSDYATLEFGTPSCFLKGSADSLLSIAGSPQGECNWRFRRKMHACYASEIYAHTPT